jgi:hypothetical protein
VQQWKEHMPQAKAYCEEYQRNISLDEAHILFFQQPPEKRRRFVFRCGDPKCRTMLQPLVVAALYDRPIEDENKTESMISAIKHRSPYFREHPNHAHIDTCTWVNDEISNPQATEEESDISTPSPTSGNVVEEFGLVFRPYRKRKKEESSSTGKGGTASTDPLDEIDFSESDEVDYNSTGEINGPRPQTSKFMATVAACFLKFTEEQRKSIPLSIEGIAKGEFYSICLPISGFHPYYQKERIYRGIVWITELDSVFFIRFKVKMSPSGDKESRETTAEIKLLKSWLTENDRALLDLLHELAQKKAKAWCFFYAKEAPVMHHGNAQFAIEDAAHIAIIDKTEIDVLASTGDPLEY